MQIIKKQFLGLLLCCSLVLFVGHTVADEKALADDVTVNTVQIDKDKNDKNMIQVKDKCCSAKNRLMKNRRSLDLDYVEEVKVEIKELYRVYDEKSDLVIPTLPDVKKDDTDKRTQSPAKKAHNDGSKYVGKNISLSGKTLVMTATAYSYNAGSKTATGTRPKRGTIAVDPRVIPLGTRLYVEGYGYGVAEDTGGVIKGNIIDVFFPEESTCVNWGRKKVKVTILS